MEEIYAPGCGLMIYKPVLAEKTMEFLRETENTSIKKHMICCRHDPKLEAGIRVINTCPGCDRRFRSLYEGISTISLWEVIANSSTFPFPNYHGIEMAIHDSCPTRSEKRVHDAVRCLLTRMNIRVIEPENTRTKATCCGDSAYGNLPVEEVYKRMKKRGDEMPCQDVVVYCLGCVRAMAIGGKRPRYILDLLFHEQTEVNSLIPESWREQLFEFIDEH